MIPHGRGSSRGSSKGSFKGYGEDIPYAGGPFAALKGKAKGEHLGEVGWPLGSWALEPGMVWGPWGLVPTMGPSYAPWGQGMAAQA